LNKVLVVLEIQFIFSHRWGINPPYASAIFFGEWAPPLNRGHHKDVKSTTKRH